MVLLLGDIFCCSDTQYNTNQTAVGTVHMPVNDYLVPLVTCTLTAAIVCLDTMLICCCLLNTIIVIIIKFWDFLWSLLCYTLVSILVLGIGIARGQYYWVLDIGCLSWYCSNPTQQPTYLHNLISFHQSSRLLLSSSQSLLHVRRIKTEFGSRPFSSTARQIWNHIHTHRHLIPSNFIPKFTTLPCRNTHYLATPPHL